MVQTQLKFMGDKNMEKCPYCNLPISNDIKKCPRCKAEIPEVKVEIKETFKVEKKSKGEKRNVRDFNSWS